MHNTNQYLAPIILFEAQIGFSNVKELVEQEHYTFEIFWSKAIPAQDKEIEENISIQRTQLIFNSKNSTHIRTREYNRYHIAGSI